MAQVIEMSEVKADFSRRLKERREEMGLTQEAVIYLLNEGFTVRPLKSLRTYQRWEDPSHPALPDGRNAVIVEQRMGVPLVGANRPRRRTRAKGPYPTVAALAMA